MNIYIHTLPFKRFGVGTIFFLIIINEDSYTHQICIYLLKKNSNIVKYYYNLKSYILKCYLFLWKESCIFSIITLVFMILQKSF